MGLRLHIAKKYDVQYSNIEEFKDKRVEIHRLFKALGCEVFILDEYGELFTITRNSFNKGIEKLRDYFNLDEDMKDELAEVIFSLHRSLGIDFYTLRQECLIKCIESLISLLIEYEKDSDHNNENLLFRFF